MRRLLILFVPLLFTAFMVGLSRGAAPLTYTLRGEPGALVYAETFDAPTDDWALYDDGQLSAQVTDGVLRLSVDMPNAAPFSTVRWSAADFDLRVRARPGAGPLNNGYGVIVRLERGERPYAATWSGLLQEQLDLLLLGAPPPAAHYLFLVSSDGYYQVRRLLGATQRELSTWIPSDAVRQGLDAVNDLRVVAQGGAFTFSVNDVSLPFCIPDNPDALSTVNPITGECVEGTMRPALTDSAAASGQFGVVAQTFSETGVVVDFDHVLVFAPGEASATATERAE